MFVRPFAEKLARTAVAFCLIALGWSCQRSEPVPSGPRPNVILYLIDTLRADHLGSYDYQLPTSPIMDRLAAQGVQFDTTYSQDSRTLGSIPSLLTSLYTATHGVGQYGNRLSTEVPTLAEVFRDGGYQTSSFITNINAGTFTGLDRGFTHYHDAIRSWRDRKELRSFPGDAFFEWLDSRDDAPFFAYVHTAEPHRPYTPPEEFESMFAGDYDGKITGYFDGINGYKHAVSEKDRAYVTALYDAEIRFADTAVGQLLEGLEKRNLRDNTIIVITSDHGEELFDHGGWNHGHSAYEELLRIPLIFAGPIASKTPGLRIQEPAQSIDIGPTLLEMVGLKPPESFQGHSLVPLMRGREDTILSQRPVYSASTKKPRKQAIVSEQWKLISAELETELYDLQTDPHEEQDRFAPDDPRSRDLSEHLKVWAKEKRKSAVPTSSQALSPVEADRLRALGYL